MVFSEMQYCDRKADSSCSHWWVWYKRGVVKWWYSVRCCWCVRCGTMMPWRTPTAKASLIWQKWNLCSQSRACLGHPRKLMRIPSLRWHFPSLCLIPHPHSHHSSGTFLYLGMGVVSWLVTFFHKAGYVPDTRFHWNEMKSFSFQSQFTEKGSKKTRLLNTVWHYCCFHLDGENENAAVCGLLKTWQPAKPFEFVLWW